MSSKKKERTSAQHLNIDLVRRKADSGDLEAQHLLAMFYLEGRGVSKDIVEAYKWLAYAAAHGHQPSELERQKVQGELTPDQMAEVQRSLPLFLALRKSP